MVLVIGLTGGIASGKSLISHCLEGLGALVIDADKLAREVVEPGTPALQEIKSFFGDDICDEDGVLCRKKLGSIIFNCEKERKKLNSIVHPRVIEKTRQAIEKNKKSSRYPAVVIDAPLLIEAGLTEMVDEVWVVAVNKETQIERLMKRDNLTCEEADMRLKTQMPLSEKLKFADRVIDNNGDKEDTIRYVQTLWEELVLSKQKA